MKNLLLLPLLTALVLAKKVDMSPEALEKTATHVVVGTVKAVYQRRAVEGRFPVTRYVAEVKVETVEKGEGLAPDGLVYVRYYRRHLDGKTIGNGGHRGLPAEGEELRIYLARNAYDGFTKDNRDGGFNVIGANGFERLPGGK